MIGVHFQYESDAWATINALRLAADQYDEDAKEVKNTRLARGFNDQATTARRIADHIEATA